MCIGMGIEVGLFRGRALSCGGWFQGEIALRVGFLVSKMSFVVVIRLFSDSNCQNQCQWCDVCYDKA